MGMTVNSNDSDDDVIGTINTTPLVDIMLVLLIIFLITVPVAVHTVPVNLPEEKNVPYETKPENIQLAVNKNGDIFWNESYICRQSHFTGTTTNRGTKETSARCPHSW